MINWICPNCSFIGESDKFSGLMWLPDGSYWQTLPLYPCQTCTDKENGEAKEREAYLNSPEGIAEAQKKREERALAEKKDLEENWYWFEGRCDECCGTYSRYIKKDNMNPSMNCGCVGRGDNEDRDRERMY